jgi:hypothetical protein
MRTSKDVRGAGSRSHETPAGPGVKVARVPFGAARRLSGRPRWAGGGIGFGRFPVLDRALFGNIFPIVQENDALIEALHRALEPLAEILIRNGVPHAAFAEVAKEAFVRVASRQEGVGGRKQTVSRMSVLTGLTRKEVARILALPEQASGATAARYHRASRVVTGWIADERFAAADGSPAPLLFDGDDASFSELVRAYSGDVPARAILDELERVEAVERDPEGRIRLLERAYLPRVGEADKLQILGTDVAGLIATIRHNLDAAPGAAYFQRKVFYDQLPPECLPELRALAAEHGQALLERLNTWMAARDYELHPPADGHEPTEVGRAGIGIYYFEENDNEERS